ncbi:Eisosome component PIL1-domain-containing protein [Phellopilus nigrolimitatus]|nr:Eisosome component PIL1-domain-containing protein [Phellopilus nigrolimitatus]
MQYSNVGPVQRIITTQKGVALDFNSVAKDAKSQSKELYMWGQHGDADIKDVTDRLAYLNFVHGALSATLSSELNTSRSPLKALRDAEKALEPKRNIRAGIQNQIARIEHEQQKGTEKRLAELKQQLQTAEEEDAAGEKEIEILKRKGVADAERAKWAALREYGEKLVLVAEASTSIISALPSIPPSDAQPYTGAQATAATRASLQHALDNYKPGSITHSFQPSAADINRSDSRSFGVTHASELSSMPSTLPQPEKSLPVTPQTNASDTPSSTSSPATAPRTSPTPLNPAALNYSPAPVPTTSPPVNSNANANVSPTDAQHTTAPVAIPEPTIAETGVPLSAGAGGPGPSSGSLKDLKKQPTPPPSGAAPPPSGIPPQLSGTVPSSSGPGTPAGVDASYGVSVGKSAEFENAGAEKARLQREEHDSLLHGSAPAQKYETAEEEKKRLEKEERDRLLNEGASKQGGSGVPSGKDDEADDATPPPYQDF